MTTNRRYSRHHMTHYLIRHYPHVWTNRHFRCLDFSVDNLEWSPFLGSQLWLSRLPHTLKSAIFFKFGFLSQSNDRRVISSIWQIFLKKTEYWRRNSGFMFSPELNVYRLIDSPITCMRSTETTFTGCHELATQLIGIVACVSSISVQKSFSAFWPSVTWSGSRIGEAGGVRGERECLPAKPSILKNSYWFSRLSSFIDWQLVTER